MVLEDNTTHFQRGNRCIQVDENFHESMHEGEEQLRQCYQQEPFVSLKKWRYQVYNMFYYIGMVRTSERSRIWDTHCEDIHVHDYWRRRQMRRTRYRYSAERIDDFLDVPQ